METLRFSNRRININTGYKIIQYSIATILDGKFKKIFYSTNTCLKIDRCDANIVIYVY